MNAVYGCGTVVLAWSKLHEVWGFLGYLVIGIASAQREGGFLVLFETLKAMTIRAND